MFELATGIVFAHMDVQCVSIRVCTFFIFFQPFGAHKEKKKIDIDDVYVSMSNSSY